jgi:hypothetical protein
MIDYPKPALLYLDLNVFLRKYDSEKCFEIVGKLGEREIRGRRPMSCWVEK